MAFKNNNNIISIISLSFRFVYDFALVIRFWLDFGLSSFGFWFVCIFETNLMAVMTCFSVFQLQYQQKLTEQ